MFVTDTIEFDGKVTRTKDGFLHATPRIARTGIQDYALGELVDEEYASKVLGIDNYDPRQRIRIYRPESVVMAQDTLNSFAAMPVTVNHPPRFVDAGNWKKYSVGDTGQDAEVETEYQSAEDKKKGRKYVRLSMMLRDAKAIKLVDDDDIKELSVGYAQAIDWTPGKDAQGNAYDAKVTKIVGNHLALVANARGGPKLRIGDTDQGDPTMELVSMTVDGITIQVSPKDKQILDKHIQELQDGLKAANDKLKTAETTIATKDGEIAGLKQQVKDAEITPEKLQAAAQDYADTKEFTESVLGDQLGEAEAKRIYSTTESMQREVVTKYMGDAAKSYDAATVAAVFDGIKASRKDGDAGMAQRKKAKAQDKVNPLLVPMPEIPKAKATGDTVDVMDSMSKRLASQNAGFANPNILAMPQKAQ